MKWNYDLDAIPRGCPVMIRTRLHTSRLATASKLDRAMSGRIACKTVPRERRVYAYAWQELTDAELDTLPERVGELVRMWRWMQENEMPVP